MEETSKENIFISNNVSIDRKKITYKFKSNEFLFIKDDYLNEDSINYFLENSPINSCSLSLIESNAEKYLLDKNFSLKPNTHDGLSFSGLIKTNQSNTLDPKDYFGFPIENSKNLKKIVFLDRDGVLVKDTNYPYKNFSYIENILPSLINAKDKGYEFIIITNQSGIGRGLYTEEEFNNGMIELNKYYRKKGITFLDCYYCPYHLEALQPYNFPSIYRKPQPGLINKSILKYQIDINNSIMIGDKISDQIYMPNLKFIQVSSDNYKFSV